MDSAATGQNGEGDGEGDRAVSSLVKLVRSTYAETMPAGHERGLARLEQALHRARSPFSLGLGRLSFLGQRRLPVAAVVMLAVVVAGAFAYRQFQSLTYEVMNGAVGPGGFVRPTAAGTTILFSEGSEITLGDAARTRVDDLTADGGRVVVESGSVHARIVHRKHARWFVDAGPYTIRVTGTAFNVKWSWDEERLDVRMDRGSVIVTGPLAPAGVTLTAGMRLMANPRSGLAIAGSGVAPAVSGERRDGDSFSRDSVSGDGVSADGFSGEAGATVLTPPPAPEAPSEQPTEEAAGTAPAAEPARGFEGLSGVVEKRRSAARERTAPSPGTGQPGRHLAARTPGTGAPWAASERWTPEHWDKQLARGDVQGILNDAAALGINRVLDGASGRELSALADAARYGHQPTLARRVLLSMRERFPLSAESRDAAFFLGGLAEDAIDAGGPTAALEWYDRYLSETGHGRYAAQALGRKLVMTQKLKGTEAARPVANDYLDRFPGGPYASAARKLMRTP